jgi:hypothetical protein
MATIHSRKDMYIYKAKSVEKPWIDVTQNMLSQLQEGLFTDNVFRVKNIDKIFKIKVGVLNIWWLIDEEKQQEKGAPCQLFQ